MSNKDVRPENDVRIPAKQRGLHKRIAELEAQVATLSMPSENKTYCLKHYRQTFPDKGCDLCELERALSQSKYYEEKWENDYIELHQAVAEFCNGENWEAVEDAPDFIEMRDLL